MLQTSGAITMAQVAAELGISATGLSLGDSRVRALAKRASGTVSFADLHGKSRLTWNWNGGEAKGSPHSSVSWNMRISLKADGSGILSPASADVPFRMFSGQPQRLFLLSTYNSYQDMTLITGSSPRKTLTPNVWHEIDVSAGFTAEVKTYPDDNYFFDFYMTDNTGEGKKAYQRFRLSY